MSAAPNLNEVMLVRTRILNEHPEWLEEFNRFVQQGTPPVTPGLIQLIRSVAPNMPLPTNPSTANGGAGAAAGTRGAASAAAAAGGAAAQAGQTVGQTVAGAVRPKTPTITSPYDEGGGNVDPNLDYATPPPLNPTNVNYPGSGLDIYASAGQGDQEALGTVMQNILESLGIDIARPGIYTDKIVAQVEPYLPIYMMMMSDEAHGGPRTAALRFRDMISGPGAFGKIQAWVNDPANQQLIADYIANAENEGTAIGAINAATAAASAGLSPMRQQTEAAVLKRLYSRYRSAGGTNPDLHYLEFLNQPENQGQVSQQLRPFLTGRTRAGLR